MRYCDHDVSLRVSLLIVLESFRDPLQRIRSVDDRPELPSRDEFCDETHQLDVRAAADSRRAKVFSQLHSGRADGPRSPDDQELLSGSDLSQVSKKYSAVSGRTRESPDQAPATARRSVSSSAVNGRPATGWTSKTRKNSCVTLVS